MCCVASVVVSGCVTQDSALDFAGNPTPQPVASGVSLAGSQQASLETTPTVGQGNIPIRAPRPSTALAATAPAQGTTVTTANQPNSNNQIASSAVTQPIASDTVNKLAVVEPNTGQTPASTVISQATPAAATPATPPAPVAAPASATITNPATAANVAPQTPANNSVEVASLSPTLEAAPSVDSTPANEVQKQSFFEKLFAPKNNKPRPARTISNADEPNNSRARSRINTAANISERPSRSQTTKKIKRPPTVVASVRNSNASQQSALPGVKSNSEIFGIKEDNKKPSNSSQTTQVASLGSLGKLSPNGLRVQHSNVQVSCLKPGVLRLLKLVERHYGKKPIITSGYRSPKKNRRAGGARNSQHIFCKAVDIQVEGVSKWKLAKFLRTLPGRGGVGTYCRTKSVHIDIGSVRDWHHPCRKSSKRKRKKA